MSMAVSPADHRLFGGRILRASAAPGPASHDSAGRRYVFVGGATGFDYALDVECKDVAPGAELIRALHAVAPGPALQVWTVIEVLAKLTATPAHLVLQRARRLGLPALTAEAGVELVQPEDRVLWITLGRCPSIRAED